jgi:hypothetical protein
MQPTPADAFVDKVIEREQINSLAILYDRFAHALDPFSTERDEAERVLCRKLLPFMTVLVKALLYPTMIFAKQ